MPLLRLGRSEGGWVVWDGDWTIHGVYEDDASDWGGMLAVLRLLIWFMKFIRFACLAHLELSEFIA